MRVIALIAVMMAVLVPVRAQRDRQMGDVGIAVFEDSNFRGRNATFRDEVTNLQSYGLNDRISSLRVAPGETWEVCEHADFQGRCQVFSGSEPDLGDRRWNNVISSMRPMRGGGGGPPIYPPVGRYGLELFEGRHFSGDRRVFSDAVENLQTVGFNDRARSLRLPRSQAWEVCSEAFFRGCLVVNTDWPDLQGLGMGRRISSVRPWHQGGGGNPPPTLVRLVLFDDLGFRGQAYTLERTASNLGNRRVGSIQVYGGRWEVCDQPNFNGRCVTLTSNAADIASLGLRRRLGSVRPLVTPY